MKWKEIGLTIREIHFFNQKIFLFYNYQNLWCDSENETVSLIWCTTHCWSKNNYSPANIRPRIRYFFQKLNFANRAHMLWIKEGDRWKERNSAIASRSKRLGTQAYQETQHAILKFKTNTQSFQTPENARQIKSLTKWNFLAVFL